MVFIFTCCIGLSGIMDTTDKTNNKSLIPPGEVGYMDYIISFDQLNACCVSTSCSVY